MIDGTPCTAPLPGWAFQERVDWERMASPRGPRFSALEQEERKVAGAGSSGGTSVPRWLRATPEGLEASKNAAKVFSGALQMGASHVPLVGWILAIVRLAVKCKIAGLEALESADELEEVLAEVEVNVWTGRMARKFESAKRGMLDAACVSRSRSRG